MGRERAEHGTVLRRDRYDLAPIAIRVRDMERGSIATLCHEIGVSRNHFYLVLRGRTAVTEDLLGRILTALGLTWSDVQPKATETFSSIT